MTLSQLQDVIKNAEINSFLKKCVLYGKQDEFYKSYLGFNFYRERLIGIKFYFTYYKDIDGGFIEQVLPEGRNDIKNFEKKALNKHYDNPNTFGVGNTFAIKINTTDDITKAYIGYVKQNNAEMAVAQKMFSSRFEIELRPGSILPYRGDYFHYSKKHTYKKQYYYTSFQPLIKKIISSYGISEHHTVPTLEIGMGESFSQKNTNEKIILLEDYLNMWEAYKSEFPESVISICADFIKNTQFNIICPGFFVNRGFYSCFACSILNNTNSNRLETIEKLLLLT